MKKIIISENVEKRLFNLFLNEEISYLGDKEEIVLNWLDNHFKAMENEISNEIGLPKTEKVVSILDSKKQITKKIIPYERLFYILQYQFKNILQDKKDRDSFLWDTLKKWYK